MKRTLIALGLLTAAVVPFTASAGHLVVGVNIGGPAYYAPPPVVYTAPPAPAYYPAPDVVYETPAPVVYGPPAVVYRPYHCWWENGYRVCR